jgi:hypothetical protein
MTPDDIKMLDDIKRKLGFDPTDREELHKALDEYYGPIGSEGDPDSDLAIDDKPSIWSKLSFEESEWLHKNHLVAF